MCIYCEKQKISIVANILEAILVVPIAFFLEKINQDLMFLCYVLSGIIPIILLAVTVSKTLKQKIEEDKMLYNRIHFCFK